MNQENQQHFNDAFDVLIRRCGYTEQMIEDTATLERLHGMSEAHQRALRTLRRHALQDDRQDDKQDSKQEDKQDKQDKQDSKQEEKQESKIDKVCKRIEFMRERLTHKHEWAALDSIDDLAKIRSVVSHENVDAIAATYCRLISHIEHIDDSSKSDTIQLMWSALSALRHVKESLGRQRALVESVNASPIFSAKQKQQFARHCE